jgi:hypothetical protein
VAVQRLVITRATREVGQAFLRWFWTGWTQAIPGDLVIPSKQKQATYDRRSDEITL